MATINFTFTHPQASYTRTFTVPDAHLVRLVMAHKRKFGADLTNAQVLERLTDNIVAKMKQDTLDIERDAARIAAASAIGEIDAT